MRKPVAVIALTIRTHKGQRGKKKLYVAIWKYLRDLREAAKATSGYGGWSDAAGCYLAVRNKSQFGEIYLWSDLIGGGYFAHELQHFMNDYSEETENHPLDQKANERMAYLAGDLTVQFWRKFYKQFGEAEGA